MAAKLVNKREPLLCIKPFKFMRRQYEIGDIVDRRMVKMLHRKMMNLIASGNLTLCRELGADELADFGYSYDIQNGRYPLLKIKEATENAADPDQEGDDESESDDEDIIDEIDEINEGDPETPEPTAKHTGSGWYDVIADGVVVNEKSLRAADVEQFIANYSLEN